MFSRGNVKRGGRKHIQGHFNFFVDPTNISPGFLVLLPLLVGVSPNTNAQTGTNGCLQWIFYHNPNYKQEVTLQQALICFQTLAAP